RAGFWSNAPVNPCGQQFRGNRLKQFRRFAVPSWLAVNSIQRALWGVTHSLTARLFLFALFTCGWLWAADRNLAMTFQVRLESGLSSYTPAGTVFDATVISP